MKFLDLFAGKPESPLSPPPLPPAPPLPLTILPVNAETAEKLKDEMEKNRLVEFSKTHPITPAHFSQPVGWEQWSLLFQAVTGGHLAQVAEAVKPSGEGFTARAFWADGVCEIRESAIDVARRKNYLDQVFLPSLWIHRVAEMENLSRSVPEEKREEIHYEKLREEAILLSAWGARKVSASDFEQARRTGGVESSSLPQTKERG